MFGECLGAEGFRRFLKRTDLIISKVKEYCGGSEEKGLRRWVTWRLVGINLVFETQNAPLNSSDILKFWRIQEFSPMFFP